MSEDHLGDLEAIEKHTFSEPWSKEALKIEISNHNAYFVVAKFNKKVVGYMGLYNIYSEGYITNIAVLKEYRRMSVGSALMSNALKFAKENHMLFLTLEVRESNHVAINFYDKYGFKKEGIRKNFYRHPIENALIMTKRF